MDLVVFGRLRDLMANIFGEKVL